MAYLVFPCLVLRRSLKFLSTQMITLCCARTTLPFIMSLKFQSNFVMPVVLHSIKRNVKVSGWESGRVTWISSVVYHGLVVYKKSWVCTLAMETTQNPIGRKCRRSLRKCWLTGVLGLCHCEERPLFSTLWPSVS